MWRVSSLLHDEHSEETYFFSLTVNSRNLWYHRRASRKPRSGQEGTRNLYYAIRAAADPNAGGKGVRSREREDPPARDVTKRVTVRVETGIGDTARSVSSRRQGHF